MVGQRSSLGCMQDGRSTAAARLGPKDLVGEDVQAAEKLAQRRPVERLGAMELGLNLRFVRKSILVHHF